MGKYELGGRVQAGAASLKLVGSRARSTTVVETGTAPQTPPKINQALALPATCSEITLVEVLIFLNMNDILNRSTISHY